MNDIECLPLGDDGWSFFVPIFGPDFVVIGDADGGSIGLSREQAEQIVAWLTARLREAA